MDYKLVQQYEKALASLGFSKTKDILGTYYSKTTHKISIMNHGHMFVCFYNKSTNNQWALNSKSEAMLDYTKAIIWVYERAKTAL